MTCEKSCQVQETHEDDQGEGHTLPKFNMEPENHPFEKEIHLQQHHFWVPC